MEMRWAPAPRPRAPRRRTADQPSFSSTLLDAICDSMDDPGRAPRTTAAEWSAASAYAATRTAAAAAKKQQEPTLHYYYYRPSLAASHRARAAPTPTPGATSADCSGRGYFSSSEVEYSLRRLRPIHTSGDSAPTQKQQQQPTPEKKARTQKPTASARGCRRPASPGARIASLLNSIFSGKRPSAQRTAPSDQEPVCSMAPSYARSCLPKTPPSARPCRSRSTRTVRFLDIDGEVAVAAAAVGRCRRIPVMEVEEVLLRPVNVEADSDGGEKSSDASSDLFELENLASIDQASSGGSRRGAYGDELPVYGTTGVALRRGIGHARPYDNGLGRSCRKVA